MFRKLTMLAVIPLCSMLMSCATPITDSLAPPILETPRGEKKPPKKLVCGDRNGGGPWRQGSYADDGDGVQKLGEDTPETIKEIRSANARQAAYCSPKK